MSAAFLAYGTALALAWFAAINIMGCLVAAAAGRRMLRSSEVGSPARWLTLRLAPAALAAAFVLLLFIPSYFKYEPRTNFEGIDTTVALIAAVGAGALLAGIVRGAAGYNRARRCVAAWMLNAEPFEAGGGVAGFIVNADSPVVALAGIWRPRLLVARQLIVALSKSELAASIAHELNHHRALDNLKRLAICAAPDVWFPRRAIDTRWALAAEYAADRFAIEDLDTRCALASALVKVARLTPSTMIETATVPVSTLIGAGHIAERVASLLDDRRPIPTHAGATVAVAAGAFALLTPLAYSPLLRAVHDLTEQLVHSLP